MFDVSPLAGMNVAHPDDRSPMRLFWDVCEANDVHPDKVRGPLKHREIVDIRQKIARVLRDHGCSLPEIGRLLDRHHTTVLSLLQRESVAPDGRRRKVA